MISSSDRSRGGFPAAGRPGPPLTVLLFIQIIHRAAFRQPQTPVRKLVLILC